MTMKENGQVKWAREVLTARKIKEDDIFDPDKDRRFEEFMRFLAEEGRGGEANMIREARTIARKYPSVTMISWAEDILEQCGLGLVLGGDMGETGGHVQLYYESEISGKWKDEEVSGFIKAARIARAAVEDPWIRQAATVRHAARAQRREEMRVERILNLMSYCGKCGY